MARLLTFLRTQLGSAHAREFLKFCAPALIVGLIIRLVITVQVPYGIYHGDTGDYLSTAANLLHSGDFEIHGKKTFLGPVLFSIPILLGFPSLIVIPLVQHTLGLLLVVLVGLLIRLWMRHWKWLIIPGTTLIAINPALLWYEHTLLAESLYVLCMVILALAGTLYVRIQTRPTFIFLSLALVLVAAARPEGKLMFGFGFLLVAMTLWGQWKPAGIYLGTLTVVALGTHYITQTFQAGLLLYTSVCFMTPSELKSAPGFIPYITEIREDLRDKWDDQLTFPRARDRKKISSIVKQYLTNHPDFKKKLRKEPEERLLRRMARETILSDPGRSVELAYRKFRRTAGEPSCENFSAYILIHDQEIALNGNLDRLTKLGDNLSGKPMDTPPLITAFLGDKYQPERVEWFNRFNAAWHNTWLSWRLPDLHSGGRTLPGVPYFYLVALGGMLIAMFRKGEGRTLQICWTLTLLGLFFTIALTANIKPRFRFVFEPFWFLYILFLFDALVGLTTKARSKQ